MFTATARHPTAQFSLAEEVAWRSVRAGSVSQESTTGISGHQRFRGTAGHRLSSSRSCDEAGAIRLWSRRSSSAVPRDAPKLIGLAGPGTRAVRCHPVCDPVRLPPVRPQAAFGGRPGSRFAAVLHPKVGLARCSQSLQGVVVESGKKPRSWWSRQASSDSQRGQQKVPNTAKPPMVKSPPEPPPSAPNKEK
jgi:hypothetical protein